MVVIAQKLGYKKIALAFGNDIGSQTFVQPAIGALKKAGMTLATNQTLDLTAATFRTEAEAIIGSHPQAIMTEALGNADATLFAEIKQLNAEVDPDHRDLRGDLATVLQGSGRGCRRGQLRVQLPRRQPGRS